MTIEQEAREEFGAVLHHTVEEELWRITKALKAKQDRIEVLDKKLELEEEELARWQDSAFRLEGNLDTALSTIETLESALKEIYEMTDGIKINLSINQLAKKALGGGANENQS